jgi:hypothetical protein
MSATKPRNYCVTCGKDFAGLDGFDRHRVGKYPPKGPAEYRGWTADWKPELGRRCLDEDELRAAGYALNQSTGLWYSEHHRARTQRLRAAQPRSLWVGSSTQTTQGSG